MTHPEDPKSVSPKVKELLDRSNAYILPVYARPPFVLAKGKGAYVWNVEGRQYLDFSAGIAVNALGHGDDSLVEVSTLTFYLAILCPSIPLAVNRFRPTLGTLCCAICAKSTA